MAITATDSSTQKELIPAGNYIARCYQMLQIGTVEEEYLGDKKMLHKVRIGWELPTEKKVFKEENGEQPFVISNEYTLSMGEKANLRKMLASWRGKEFSADEAKAFDITALLGVPCMLNIIHKPSKDGTKMYQQISGVTPMPRGMICPEQINENALLQYDNFNFVLFKSLPEFIRHKIESSEEYNKMQNPDQLHVVKEEKTWEPIETDDLPF